MGTRASAWGTPFVEHPQQQQDDADDVSSEYRQLEVVRSCFAVLQEITSILFRGREGFSWEYICESPNLSHTPPVPRNQ